MVVKGEMARGAKGEVEDREDGYAGLGYEGEGERGNKRILENLLFVWSTEWLMEGRIDGETGCGIAVCVVVVVVVNVEFDLRTLICDASIA